MSADNARAFRRAVEAGHLYIGPVPVVWKRYGYGQRAKLPIEGAPEGIGPYLLLHIGGREHSFSITLIWNERIYGYDTAGDPHRDARQRTWLPPHRHWFNDNEDEDAAPVDIAAAGIVRYQDALQWFLDWIQLPSGHEWGEPLPVQQGQPGTLPTAHEGKKRQ